MLCELHLNYKIKNRKTGERKTVVIQVKNTGHDLIIGVREFIYYLVHVRNFT